MYLWVTLLLPFGPRATPVYARVAALCLGWVLMPGAHALAPPPSDLAQLGRSLIDADASRRYEFADALLDVLQQSYQDELAASAREQLTSDTRRARLRSWRRATQALLDRLQQARMRLSEGGDALVRVDAQHQVLLFIDDQPIAFSAPRPGTEQVLERAAIARYCAVNDCAFLESQSGEKSEESPSGSWSLGDRRAPAYEFANHFRCSFRDLAGRDAKQRACEAAAAETADVVNALRHTANSGHSIDWQRFAHYRRVNGPDVALYPLATETALQMTLPHLARLDPDNWAALAAQLSGTLQRSDLPVTIEHAEQLLAQ